MKPIVLISSSSEYFESKGTDLFFLRSAYIKAVEQLECLPIIPSFSDAKEYASIADFLILSGGDDIDPSFYNQQNLPNCKSVVQRERDIFEFELLSEFCRLNKPVLGICRGLQLINVAFGGSLWQNLSVQKSVFHNNKRCHQVSSSENSICRSLFGESFSVNSFHNQGIDVLGEDLKIEAVSCSDGIIEAIRHKNKPIFAVQWHPELMPEMKPIFSHFINKTIYSLK